MFFIITTAQLKLNLTQFGLTIKFFKEIIFVKQKVNVCDIDFVMLVVDQNKVSVNNRRMENDGSHQ